MSEFGDNAQARFPVEMRVNQNTQVFDFRILENFFATNFKERIKGKSLTIVTIVSED